MLFRFNSNMVRLKVKQEIEKGLTPELFQFQYGAIKSRKTLNKCRNLYSVSIPIWCD